MSATIDICLWDTCKGRERMIQITPAWSGKGIAIHKPVSLDKETGEMSFCNNKGVWVLTHISSGLSIGVCFGSLDRAKSYARQWDMVFAAVRNKKDITKKLQREWQKVNAEMMTIPRRKPLSVREAQP
jgi:hypothetical protein